jgi:O-succinylhomoserine sulfhydrylase
MNSKNQNKYHPATLAVRAGQHRTSEQEHSEPIFTTSSFVFDSAAQAAARFGGEEEGNVYSRFTNPTVRTFEERLAAMEGAECCVATSSGMSAILAMCLGLLKSGDHVLCSEALFGSTTLLFTNILSKFDVEFEFVPMNDFDAWKKRIKSNTVFVYIETPTNPLTEMVDIRKLAALIKETNSETVFVVDNCFATPVLQRPLELGADIVIHSATKYIDGQGRCVGGAIVGDKKLVGEKIYAILRSGGMCMSPFNAWVFLKGLETLSIRMEKACLNAQAIADFLVKCEDVTKVYYPGLDSHPQHYLVGDQISLAGAIVSFELKDGKEQAWQLIDNTELYSITGNLGDTRSTITHPATTTHGRLKPEQRTAFGISDSLVRISVGLEDVRDLIDDLKLS